MEVVVTTLEDFGPFDTFMVIIISLLMAVAGVFALNHVRERHVYRAVGVVAEMATLCTALAMVTVERDVLPKLPLVGVLALAAALWLALVLISLLVVYAGWRYARTRV